jgi:hypothetical protein
MGRMIDQIRASKLPSNMMQFAARGALAVPPAENIEILVYLARHNKVFGDLARMTLAGWDEKASLAAAANPETTAEVLDYFISPDNLRPKLLPALLENPSVSAEKLAKLAISATRETIETMLKSARVRGAEEVLEALQANPYLKKEESDEIGKLLLGGAQEATTEEAKPEASRPQEERAAEPCVAAQDPKAALAEPAESVGTSEPADEEVSAYLAEHAGEIAAEEGKPFQAIGGVVDLLGADYFPVSQVVDTEVAELAPAAGKTPAPVPSASAAAKAAAAAKKRQAQGEPKRENTLQKIKALDVKGRIQLALKGNKEERSILIREGTKVVALAVLDAPKITDGEVEQFASQKNVLEAVLRQIPLKRRFMKNYNVVRNLVFNPRTPLDLSLGLMKNLLAADLKHLSGNKEVSETIRKLALKMFKQKMETATKK